MTYVASFYKNQNLNYTSFFNNFESNDELNAYKQELDKLARQLEEKKATYSLMLGNCYNSTLTPVSKMPLFRYNDREGISHYFDSATGLSTIYDADRATYTLSTKNGNVSVMIGYCYELGSVVVKNYKYSIPSNNSKIILKLEEELLVPIIDPTVTTVAADVNENGINPKKYRHNYWGNGCIQQALGTVPADEFLNTFYGINRDFKGLTLMTVRTSIIKNKAFEVIIRTAPDIILDRLLEMSVEQAGPLHDIIGVSKADYQYAEQLGVLRQLVDFKNNFKKSEYYKSPRFNAAISKTDKEWIDLLEKCKSWEEDLQFYGIRWSSSGAAGLIYTLIRGYVGGEYPFYSTHFPQHYPLGKFCSYVVEEAVNQGYTSISDFIKMLSDYISMCDTMRVTPTLYSSYLHQTHDITSRNHKIKLDEEQTKAFAIRYENFKSATFDNYTIVAPKSPADVQAEGDALNHCVASYIKRIVDGNCMIYFLRDKEDVNTPLVTFEVRDNAVVQAKGLHNRHITNTECTAITKWALSNKMKVRV